MENDNEYYVVTNYKGNPSSIIVSPRDGEDVEDCLKRMKILGVVKIYDPNQWEYDEETCNPRLI
ncbi:MAG: hypothetical protein EKK64_00560 [Neisseriaceae bacterium]|nr:MAG: hypothetical protein EKK64_00560 [Neisseriaceae bacterium]